MGDRLGALMVRAHVSGAFDFRRADPRDRRWWLSLGYVIDEVDRRDRLEEARDDLLSIVGYLARGDFDRASTDSIRKMRQGSVAALDRYRRPWVAKQTVSEAAVNAAMDLWKRAFGDPKDPAVAAKIERDAQRLREQGKEARRGR